MYGAVILPSLPSFLLTKNFQKSFLLLPSILVFSADCLSMGVMEADTKMNVNTRYLHNFQ